MIYKGLKLQYKYDIRALSAEPTREGLDEFVALNIKYTFKGYDGLYRDAFGNFYNGIRPIERLKNGVRYNGRVLSANTLNSCRVENPQFIGLGFL